MDYHLRYLTIVVFDKRKSNLFFLISHENDIFSRGKYLNLSLASYLHKKLSAFAAEFEGEIRSNLVFPDISIKYFWIKRD